MTAPSHADARFGARRPYPNPLVRRCGAGLLLRPCARFVRAEFLSLREQDFVVAAVALGLPERRIIFQHMVPNAVAPVLVSATIGVAGAILTESALSFLGFGVQPPFATWGNVLADGRGYLFDAPWLFFVPGAAIFGVVLAFNLVGEGLREALNPRLRRRR